MSKAVVVAMVVVVAVAAVAAIAVVIVVVFNFDFAGGARAWTRQAPWYLPCGEVVCIVRREFEACVYV